MTLTKEIVLASASPRRQEILHLAGIAHRVYPAQTEWAPADLPPAQRVLALAHSKAQAVASQQADALILAADTMVVLDDCALGKPPTPEAAVDMLLRLQGRTHEVMTGVSVVRTDAAGNVVKQDGFTDIAEVSFFPMTREEALSYVQTGECMDKAGAYAIQGFGMRFVREIRGDFYTVMGLPGGHLIRYLQEFAPDLWE